ncbi:peptidase M12 [Pseudomonas entomophila]|uniref:M12 family metallopeptidase n=1 Tax=Pseudomonas entomophila TaxID=312306 RepID=UPI001BCF39C4|nr:M12 family metallopeptidase [Pseudomonas entomophila]QVM90281.1 peptidase M12 [Pseudomonas entomophila]
MTNLTNHSCQPHSAPYESRMVALAQHPRDLTSPQGNRRKRSVGYSDKLWAPGQTLRISFVNEPAETLKSAIMAAANKWLPFINLKFQLVEDDLFAAEIKIHTGGDPKQNYAMFGTDALRAADASMVLGITPDMDNFEYTVIHEFGHALGMEHEHQHPDADIPWDVPKVYAHYAAKGYDQETVDEAVLSKITVGNLTKQPYDRHSIMHYPVDQALTVGDWEVGINSQISEKDKAFMRAAYPYPSE